MALTEYFQMSTHVPGFQLFSASLHHFVLTKSATSSITAKFNAYGWLPRGGEAVKGFSFVVYFKRVEEKEEV